MKVVIGANSLTGQLTGIGHYTRCLVEGLSRSEDIEELRLLSHGWLGEPVTPSSMSASTSSEGSTTPSDKGSSLLGKLRPMASRSRLLVELYDVITSMTARFSLRKYGRGDIFHSPDFQYAAFPGKTIVTIPDLSTMTYPEFHPASRVAYINRHIERTVKKADHIVTISNFVRREILNHFPISGDRVTTIYPGIDADFSPISFFQFDDVVKNPSIEFKKYWIFVSTIEPRKNLGLLLDAYEHYLGIEKSSALPLVVTGHPGWSSSDLHDRLLSLGRQNKVYYLGYVNRASLRVLIAGARALLFPSLYEGFGLPVVEAMKSGTAVMTSKYSAMAEFSGRAAVLVTPTDSSDIANGILALHKDQQLVTKLELEGILVAKRFSWDRAISETVSLYSTIVG